MMKTWMTIVVGALLLSGCGQKDPVRSIGDIPEVEPVQMPPLGEELGRKAERLPDLSGPDQQSQQRDAIEADRAYNDIAHQLNNLIDFYSCVREGMNTRDHKVVDACLRDKE